MVDDFNNSDIGPINDPTYVHDFFIFLFFAKEMLNGEIFGDIPCHDLRQKLNHVFQHQNSKLHHVSARVGRLSWMASLTMFSLIRFWSEYSEDQENIFTETTKEDQREILCRSNLGRI